MEQERIPGSGPNPGLCGCDRDLFKRVWERVMPEEENCPIEVLPPPEAALAVVKPLAAPVTLPAANRSGEKAGAERAPACLGTGSAVYGEQLREFIADELADWRFYRALAGRLKGCPAKTISDIAADEHRHAKRLAAAYFLISGTRCWPRVTAGAVGNCLDALRRRFSAEQQGAADYLAAAGTTDDRCLRDLYLELAAQETRHAEAIRGVLEQM